MLVRIATTYPCCSRKAVVKAMQFVPIEKYDRYCSKCNTQWTVTRHSVRDRDGVRVDVLDWES